ncbi:MAG TPA: hydantoinase/oxoprolinase family protein [Kribbella sp.]
MDPTARIGVDVGGTFTDLVLHDEARGLTAIGKRLTTPQAPNRAIIEGIEQLLAETGTAIDQVDRVVHGTTLITNTVLERTGATVGLITTDGFRDIVEMGREIRYDVEDLFARPAPVIVPRHLRYGVGGRMRADGSEHAPLDEQAVLKAARTLVHEFGVEAVAVAFLHSYANPAHELGARELIHDVAPGLPVTLSAEVAPEIREYERTSTACLNAYVQPAVQGYLDQLERDLDGIGFGGLLSIMLSGGGITTVDQAKAFPVRLLESGPAGGAIAAASVARAANEAQVVSFDMGGTTAKMCLVENGRPHVKHEFEAGRLDKFKPGSGIPLKLTVIDMIEIGTGGGSIAAVDGLGLLKVGPRSAGSVPGPIAYGRGGQEPTVTDSDLLSGYLDPDNFLGGDLSLSLAEVQRALARLGDSLAVDGSTAAAGIQELVIENMAAATRMHLAEKGRDPRAYTLLAFGGAGPVHAYALAKRLKISRVIVPVGAGVMSAFGFLAAAPTVDDVRGYPTTLTTVDWPKVEALYAEMESHVRGLLRPGTGELLLTRTADMRYAGQGFEVSVPLPTGELGRADEDAIHTAFVNTYQEVFGRTIRGGTPELINWRLAACLPAADFRLLYKPRQAAPGSRHREVYFAGLGRIDVPVYDRSTLAPGTTITGPALFEERETSCSVGPDCTVTVDRQHNLIIDILPTTGSTS